MKKYIDPSLKNVPLEALDLSKRPFNALKRAGIHSVYDLYCVIEEDGFSKISNIGELSISEIISKADPFLASYNQAHGFVDEPSALSIDSTEYPKTYDEIIKSLDIGMISDCQINLLSGYLGGQLVEQLSSIETKTIGDLHNLLLRYMNFLFPGNQLIDKTISLLKNQIRALIDQGNLSANCFVESTHLHELLNVTAVEEGEKKAQIRKLKSVIESISLTHEITEITSDLSERQKEIFLDYSLRELKLEEIAQTQVVPVTRERIRQILSEARAKLRRGLDKSWKIYLVTTLEVANELGTSLSQEAWKTQLIERNILTDSDQNYQSFDYFCALIKDKETSQSIFSIPESVKTTLNKLDSQPLYVSKYLDSDTKGKLRRVKRIVNYTGGIDLLNAEQTLGCKTEEVAGILKTQGITEIIPGWFSYLSKTGLDNKTSLFRAGLIMTQACGPLSFESFCEGLQRYISRHFNTLAPAEVIKHVLYNFGFKIENNLVTYNGEEKVLLSNSDNLLLELLNEKGPVLSFQNLVEFYMEKGLSFSTATTRVMPDSPILEKADFALYKLRGSEVTQQDLESAKSRQDETARNIEIIFGSDRIVRYRVNLGSWGIGGVLSISQSLPALPDFSEGWPVYVGEEQIGTASRDETLIWGLTAAFQKLGVKVGDRVELAIDQRKTKKIVVRIIEEKD